jgi:60S ribosomal subunit assembly/export protein LOC1
VKNKHAAPKTESGSGSGGAKRSAKDGVSKSRSKPKGPVVSQQLKEKNRALLLKKPKRKIYTAEELGVPKLNMITPVGVVKPKGKKKGKVFVDDRVGLFSQFLRLWCPFRDDPFQLLTVNRRV